MCVIAISFQQHPKFPLVIAANRDEFFKRPTRSINWWSEDPNLLAGKDLTANGTWAGFTRSGKFAAITNVREGPASANSASTSRGSLPLNYLQGELSPADYLQQLAANADQFEGFNLFVGDSSQLFYFSNRDNQIRQLGSGLYACSNGTLDSQWPKVEQLKTELSAAILAQEVDLQALFAALKNHSKADRARLPDTGVGLDWERLLSPIFIESPAYGTRVSTVVLIDHQGRVTFVERAYASNANGQPPVTRRFDFEIENVMEQA